MKIVFLSNYLNHHQKPLSDELYRLTEGNYTYIDTAPMSEVRHKLGYRELDAPYMIKCYNHPTPPSEIAKIIDEADAVIIGSAPDSYITSRTKAGKLTFKYSERLYKSEPSKFKLLYHRWRFHRNYSRNPNCYLLCASAYTASDYHRIGCFVGRAFKWGYFPAVEDCTSSENTLEAPYQKNSKLKILWVGRFLNWKHPELPVALAKKLKADFVDFELNMYGIGEEYERIGKMIADNGLTDRVKLCGSTHNEEILRQMRSHDILLFTSDRNEGWGAVANEAMGSRCVLVASDAIGSTPFLIENGVNGMVFRNENLNDLYKQVKYLIDNPEQRMQIAENAYRTVHDLWSPVNAARSIISLITGHMNGQITPTVKGPGSIA
ncbi:glycosyltransferase family 4 protein [uncultured Bacteroides sp.]|nr:glycosyltransferase family 4 protein [uncultured Bacteroides sp.]